MDIFNIITSVSLILLIIICFLKGSNAKGTLVKEHLKYIVLGLIAHILIYILLNITVPLCANNFCPELTSLEFGAVSLFLISFFIYIATLILFIFQLMNCYKMKKKKTKLLNCTMKLDNQSRYIILIAGFPVALILFITISALLI